MKKDYKVIEHGYRKVYYGREVMDGEIEEGGIYATMKYAKATDGSKYADMVWGLLKFKQDSSREIDYSWNVLAKERWSEGGVYTPGGKLHLFKAVESDKEWICEHINAIITHDKAVKIHKRHDDISDWDSQREMMSGMISKMAKDINDRDDIIAIQKMEIERLGKRVGVVGFVKNLFGYGL